MVSRRNFFAITAVMLIICFLFQSLNVAKEYWNDYEVNSYAQDTSALPGKGEVYTADAQDTSQKLLVLIGDEKENRVFSDWAFYMKWAFASYDSLSAYEKARKAEKISVPEFLVLQPENLDWTKDISKLKNCLTEGINLVFSSLPDVQTMKQQEALQNLLGIESITAESTTAAGLHLYEGFLLGGETIYQADNKEEEKLQDMELTFPWYHLSSGTKVYMKGIPKEKSVKTENYPVLIWRKSYENACVFAVNGNYMEGMAGLGILTGMRKETENYTLYPIINAQNLVIANYPGLAEENDAVMQKLYSQSMQGVFRDIIWPAVSSINSETSLGLSCMMSPQFDYTDQVLPNTKDLSYYLKLINEEKGEAGLSGYTASNTSLPEKLEADRKFFQENLPEYKFSSFYNAERTEEELHTALKQPFLENIRTIAQPYSEDSPLIAYQTNAVTRQSLSADVFAYTYQSDFLVKSIESALGYTGVLMDVSRLAYPQTESDTAEILLEKFSANVNTYWKPFRAFEGTTLSESDGRIRSFLSLSYEESRKDNQITLKKSGTDETAWFLLRTHNECVKQVEGGSFKKVEEDAWLIQAEKENVTITLGPSDTSYYYQ